MTESFFFCSKCIKTEAKFVYNLSFARNLLILQRQWGYDKLTKREQDRRVRGNVS